MYAIDGAARATLFENGRTFSRWQEGRRIDDATLHELIRLAELPPTSANCSPARYLFVRSPEAKERLKPCLMDGNVDQTMSAPVTVILAYDMAFYEHLPRLFPHTDAKSWFAGNDDLIAETAFRNGSLEGAYLIMAARALGLDCGPMSGFDKQKVDEAFLADTTYKSNFLINLGYGDRSKLRPRSPRFNFEDVAKVV